MISHFYHRLCNLFILLVAALLTASCTQEEEVSEAVGYLCFPSFQVDMTVENLVESRSVSLPGVPVDASQVTFVVKDKNGGEVYNALGAWTSPLVLPVGTYTIDATYGTNTFGAPYFQASVSGTIEGLEQEKPTLQMSLANAYVCVSLSDALAEHFTPSAVTLTSGAQSLEAALNSWCYVPSGQALAIKIDGTNSVGTAASFPYTLSNPEGGKAYNVVCDKEGTNWPSITLPEQQDGAWNTRLYIAPATVAGNISEENKAKLIYEVSASGTDWSNAAVAEQVSGEYYYAKGLTNGNTYYVRARIGNVLSEVKTVTVNENLPGTSVTAAHYNDGNGHLAGTNATLAFELTETLKEWQEKGLLEVQDFTLLRGTTTVRTATAKGLMTPSAGWPYLPQQGSSYVLNVKHKLTTADQTVLTSSSSYNAPAPSFALNLTSYSSYDRYKAGEKDAANNMNAFTVDGIGAKWTVAADLISNTNYSKSFSYGFNTTASAVSISGTAYSAAAKTGLALGSYPVSASLTFDGVTASASATHHITGIPYRQEPPVESAWTAEKNHSGVVTWSSDKVTLRPNPSTIRDGYARITSKQQFLLPADVNVNLVHNGYKKNTLDVKYYLRFGSTALINGVNNYDNENVNYDASTVFGAGTYQVQIETTYRALNMTSSHDVSKVNVLYGPLP